MELYCNVFYKKIRIWKIRGIQKLPFGNLPHGSFIYQNRVGYHSVFVVLFLILNYFRKLSTRHKVKVGNSSAHFAEVVVGFVD